MMKKPDFPRPGKMKVGLFGGTFNPFHMGHLTAARKTKETFQLDKLIFIPSAIPPHKDMGSVAQASDRYEMIHQSISEDADFTVSDVEIKRSGFSYTIDTVLYFRKVFPENTELFLIMGIDAFLEIDTWKSYADLLRLTPLIVMARPGEGHMKDQPMRKTLEDYLKSKISREYAFSKSCFSHDKNQPIFFFDTPLLDISSTKIRALIHHLNPITSLVPEKVEKIIQRKGLYL